MPFVHNTTLNPEQIFLKSSEFTTLNNSTKKSSISFALKNLIKIPSNVDGYIQLNSFKYINSFYNVNTTNNVFYFSLNGLTETLTTIYSIIIPIGNYTITSLIEYLNDELASYIELEYLSSTFKIRFTSTTYTFIIRSGVNNCLKLLGFSESTSEVSTITSTNLINLAGTQMLYITLGNLHISSNTSTSAVIPNILDSINVDVLSGSASSYYNTSNTKFKLIDNNISQINIDIYDENNAFVDFNNTDWYLSLSIIFSYKNQLIPINENELINSDEQTINENNISS